MNKKIMMLFISIILIVTVSFKINDIKKKKNYIKVQLVDNLKIEFNSKIKISDLIKKINGTIVDDDYIDTNKLGKQEVIVHFKNNSKYNVKYSFEVEVVDTVKPIIWLSGKYKLPLGSTINLTDKILCGDNYDPKPKCYIEGKYNINKEGQYPLIFKAEDSSGNIASEPFILTIYKPMSIGNNIEVNRERTEFNDIVKKHKNSKTKIGIDVSKWQGDIDFKKLKKAGVEFVIIRLGGTRGTNGEYFIDDKFKQNIKKAKENGLLVGLYFYSYADSVNKTILDSMWIVKQIKEYEIDLPIAFDWEEWAYYNEYNLSFYELTSMAEAFNYILSLYGYKSMLYSSKSYLEYIWLENNLDVWLAHYTNKTNYEGIYKFWQLCDNGHVDGIKGNVDIDIMYLD